MDMKVEINPYSKKRRHVRAPIRAAAELVQENGETTPVSIAQIGEGGCFLVSDALFPEATRLHVRLYIPGHPCHAITAEVRGVLRRGAWKEEPELQGMACQFMEVSKAARQAIRSHVENMRKIYKQLHFYLACNNGPSLHLDDIKNQAALDHITDDARLKRKVQREVRNLSGISNQNSS